MKNVERQGGSIVGFVIVGVLLVLLALGVFYGVKRFAMNDETPPMTLSGLVDNQDTKNENSSDGQRSGDQGSNSSNNESSTTDKTNNQDNSTQGSSSGQSGSNLPQSGPAETVSTALALTLLTVSVTAYARSRQLL